MRTDGEGPQPLGMSRNKGTQRTRRLSTENARWMLRKWEGRLLTYARRWTKGGEPDAVKACAAGRGAESLMQSGEVRREASGSSDLPEGESRRGQEHVGEAGAIGRRVGWCPARPARYGES